MQYLLGTYVLSMGASSIYPTQHIAQFPCRIHSAEIVLNLYNDIMIIYL